MRLCEQLGLLVNQEKSELPPVQSIVFLGERLDLVQGLGLPDERTPASRRSIGGTSNLPARSQVRSGRITAGTNVGDCTHDSTRSNAYATVPWLEVIRQVRAERNGNAWIPVIGQSAKALKWWTHVPHWQIGVPFHVAPPQDTVFTDASSMGWGVAFQGKMWSGVWQRPHHHINWLELRAVLVAVQLLQFHLRGKTVVFIIDNATTVSYLKRQRRRDHVRYSSCR